MDEVGRLYKKILDNQNWKMEELDKLLELVRAEGYECGRLSTEKSLWVSVKERLPKNDDNVFYTNYLSGALGVGYYVDGKWCEACTGDDLHGVTHWMKTYKN